MNDVATPIIFTKNSRKEIFIVCYDGFIKNPSEGLIRTMLSEIDRWEDRYPYLSEYRGISNKELYDQTMLYPSDYLLRIISGNQLTDEEIKKDIAEITPNIYVENSEITSFEFALYQLLQEPKVEKCYMYKDGFFYQNEIEYIITHYKKSYEKIKLVDDTNFPSLVEAVHPTTLFVTDPAFPFDYMINGGMTEEERRDKVIILLNSINTIEESNETPSGYDYKKEFKEKMDEIVTDDLFEIVPMYNFKLIDQENKIES